uniref:Uncharacterized protein n=1 Tax=Lactuca sativa TaxID=4236 RepID=A0A9R1XUR2_LACSA|nr:hypothetical protein LSAT_V11C200052400 [Lactuca sativa]
MVLSKEYPKMEAANETKRQVVPILMVPINRYLRYLILCTIYMREMVIKMTELNVVKDGVVTSGFYQGSKFKLELAELFLGLGELSRGGPTTRARWSSSSWGKYSTCQGRISRKLVHVHELAESP